MNDATSAAGIGDRRITVLLIDDQAFVGEAVRRMLASQADIDFHFCADPKIALQRAAEVAPTVILQDLVMPDVDGLTLLQSFRANEATRDVPMIVLSTKEEPKVKAEAFGLGAHDYLVKLPDPIELIARVRHHSSGYIAQLQRNAAYEALQRSEQKLAAELAQAAKYVESMLPERLNTRIETDWKFISSAQLGGDSFGYHWIDEAHFAIYLLDVCGHGVRSALLSISAMNAIRSQALNADFRSPEQVLAALNNAFDMERHDGMYFTMWYGVYVRPTRELRYSTGGHPPAVLVKGRGGQATASPLTLHGMIVGAFPGMEFAGQSVTIEPADRLYIFSDGIYEVRQASGAGMWTYEEFVDALQAAPDSAAVSHIIKVVEGVQGPGEFEDDVSILEVRFAE